MSTPRDKTVAAIKRPVIQVSGPAAQFATGEILFPDAGKAIPNGSRVHAAPASAPIGHVAPTPTVTV